MDLWAKNFDKFMKKLQEKSPNTEVIINSARFINDGFDGNENVVLSEKRSDDFKPFHIHRFNILWNFLDTYAIYKYNLRSIPFELNKYYCPKDHPWGWFYVHYNQKYYDDTYKKIKKTLVTK